MIEKEPIKVFWKCTRKCRFCKMVKRVKTCTCPDRSSAGPCYKCGGI